MSLRQKFPMMKVSHYLEGIEAGLRELQAVNMIRPYPLRRVFTFLRSCDLLGLYNNAL